MDIERLAGLVAEHEVVEVVVGLPRTLAGRHGPAAAAAQSYAAVLAERIAPVPVRLHDERLSTVAATRALRDSGVRGRRQRAVVDQAAAVQILQSWLDRPPAQRTSPPVSGPRPTGPSTSSTPGGDR